MELLFHLSRKVGAKDGKRKDDEYLGLVVLGRCGQDQFALGGLGGWQLGGVVGHAACVLLLHILAVGLPTDDEHGALIKAGQDRQIRHIRILKEEKMCAITRDLR